MLLNQRLEKKTNEKNACAKWGAGNVFHDNKETTTEKAQFQVALYLST